MSTMRRVADAAQVTPSTVSRVFRRDPRISQATQQRVLAAAAALGYRYKGRLRAGSPLSVELVIMGLQSAVTDHVFFNEVYQGALQVLSAAGHTLRAAGTNAVAEVPQICDAILNRPRADAYLLGWQHLAPDFVRRLQKQRVPFVIVGTDLPGVAANLVGIDEFGGGYALAEHVSELGRKRFAFIAGAADDASCRLKLAGARAALAERGLDLPDERVIPGQWSVAGGYEAMRRLFGQATRPDAILTSHDQMALGAIRYAQEQRLAVPDDLAVTGYDDLAFAGFVNPALTTIRTPRAELGHAAAELLLSVLGGSDRTTKIQFKPELIVRESCGAKTGRYVAGL